MLFLDAIDKLKSGVAMHRSSWTAADGYLVLMPDMLYVWKVVTCPTPNAGNFIFSVEDFLASDWVPYEPPVAIEPVVVPPAV